MKLHRRTIKRSCDCDWDEPEVFYGIGSYGGIDTLPRMKARSVSIAAHEAFETARITATRIKPGFHRT